MGIFQRQTHVVELYQGDWRERLNDAAAAVEKAQKTGAEGLPLTLDETYEPSDEYVRAVEHYNAVREQALAEGIIRVTVQALPPQEWEDLVEANPPREGEGVPSRIQASDAVAGVNETALGRALVPASIVKVEPEMTKDELLAGVNSVQFDDIYHAAFMANRGRGFDPKGAPALTPSQSSSGTEN